MSTRDLLRLFTRTFKTGELLDLSPGEKLTCVPVVNDQGSLEIGNGTKDIDLKIYLGSTTEYVSFDVGLSSLVVNVPMILTGVNTVASRLLQTSPTNNIESVSNLTNYIAGTASVLTVTDDGDGTVTLAIPNDAITYARMQNVSAGSTLLGRGDSGIGDPQEITLGSGLAMTGTTLSSISSEWTDASGVLHPADSSGAQVVVIGGTTAANADIVLGDTGQVILNEQGSSLNPVLRVEGVSQANLLYVNGTDNKLIVGNSSAISSSLVSIDGFADVRQLTIQGHSSQTANLTEWQNSAGTALSFLNSTALPTFQREGITAHDDVIVARGYHNGADNRGGFVTVSCAQGSVASPTVVFQDRELGGFRVQAYNGSTYDDYFKILVSVTGGNANLATADSTALFYTWLNGTEVLSATMKGQGLSLGSGTPNSTTAQLVTAASSGNSFASFESGSTRFSVGTNGTNLLITPDSSLTTATIAVNPSRAVSIGHAPTTFTSTLVACADSSMTAPAFQATNSSSSATNNVVLRCGYNFNNTSTGTIRDNGEIAFRNALLTYDDAVTNAVTFAARLAHTTTGTPANGIGVGIQFVAETSASNNEVIATINAVAHDTTSTSEDGTLVFSTMVAGSTTLVEGLCVLGRTVGAGFASPPDRTLHAEVDDATTNAVTYAARFTHTTSGTPATNIGVGVEFEVETSAGNNEVLGTIECRAVDVTGGSEDAEILFYTMAAGSTTLVNRLIIRGDHILLPSLPTADPGIVGALYRTGGAVMISI